MQRGPRDLNGKASPSALGNAASGDRDAPLSGATCVHTGCERSTYPPQFLVLQGQDAGALCEQLHLHSRQRVGRGEVALGAPAVDRTGEVRVETSAWTRLNSAAFCLGRVSAGLTEAALAVTSSSPPLPSKAARVTKSVN